MIDRILLLTLALICSVGSFGVNNEVFANDPKSSQALDSSTATKPRALENDEDDEDLSDEEIEKNLSEKHLAFRSSRCRVRPVHEGTFEAGILYGDQMISGDLQSMIIQRSLRHPDTCNEVMQSIAFETAASLITENTPMSLGERLMFMALSIGGNRSARRAMAILEFTSSLNRQEWIIESIDSQGLVQSSCRLVPRPGATLPQSRGEDSSLFRMGAGGGVTVDREALQAARSYFDLQCGI